MMAALEGMMLINLTFPGFALNLLWSIPVGLTGYAILRVGRLALKDAVAWFEKGGGANREAFGFLYLAMLSIGLYILIDITVAIYDPIVLYQAAGIVGLLLLRLALLTLDKAKRK